MHTYSLYPEGFSLRRLLIALTRFYNASGQPEGKSRALSAFTSSRMVNHRSTIYGSALQAQTTQAHLWNALPPDVITSILERLSFRDAWTCCSLSSCWASVRASVPIEIVIPAARQNLRAKLRRLQQFAPSSLPGHRLYTFKLKALISVTDCSSLLRSLTKQVRPCPLS